MRRKQQQQQQQPLLDSEGRVAHAASLDYAFRSYRNFLPPRGQQQGSDEQQQRFIEGLIADCSVAYNAGMEVSRISHADGDGSYYNNKGSTFFISSSEEPRFALEALALQVFRVHVGSGLGAGYDASSSGAEWWSQVVDADETIGSASISTQSRPAVYPVVSFDRVCWFTFTCCLQDSTGTGIMGWRSPRGCACTHTLPQSPICQTSARPQ